MSASGDGQNKAATSVEDMVASVDTGGRNPTGWQKQVILATAFIWAVFQLYIASNVPFWLTETFGVNVTVPSTEARRIHLAFALVLAAMAFPLLRSSPRNRIPWYDWVLAALGIVVCLYAIVFKDAISVRAGLPTTADLVISTTGMIVVGVAVFRSLGLPLLIVGGLFLLYCFFGDARWLPEAMQWKGASYGKAMWHYWMQDEGVFGVALKVSAELIFLFVLFGAILEKAGAGNYFIKIAFALLGHLRGGPAKAAVVASAMSGLYSGSSIANTVTTGTFTIPLMKRTGFSPEKAGAVEVASSTNGQLTPPVMGAAAFLIAEFTGVAYTEIIMHALVPALVSYIALVYIVHLEALKLDLKGLPKRESSRTLTQKLLGFLTGFIFMAALTAAVYFGLGWIKEAMPQNAFAIVTVGVAAAYLWLLWIASRRPDLVIDDPNAPITELPDAGETAKTGYYFILPIVVLIWCIVVERLSPSLSAFWATVSMIIVALTQHPIKSVMRGENEVIEGFRRGIAEWVEGMISGSRNMIGIGVATAAAGIIVGTVSLTGMHQMIADLIEFLSGGSLIILLLLVAVMSLILGMGLPTTANYIVVSSLMAPVIVILGAESGLVVPLIAAHLFVFYFGILADDTPPVGLAAFAAAAISQGDPIKTGIQGFMYDIRTALLPFLFIFNTELLLIDVSPLKAVFVFGVAVLAMMLFAAATQGYFLARNRIWETAMLLLVAFTLFRPGYWLDQVSPEFDTRSGTELLSLADAAKPGTELRLTISGPDFNVADQSVSTVVIAPIEESGSGAGQLTSQGLMTMESDGEMVLEEPMFGTPNQALGQQFDFYADDPVVVSRVQIENDRFPKELFYIPALVLLGLVILLQRRRQEKPAF
ncbi:TRAP transporter permease [Rhodobacteraceae bacterium NNCM2]|nr:TRAP transporter permease [Coraliihabitans acroporae]